MPPPSTTRKELLAELEALRIRLEEDEEALRAIRAGEVDAVVVNGPKGDRIYTLRSPDEPYRELIEELNEGAVTLSGEGQILYCNRRFSEIVRMPSEHVIGADFNSFVEPGERPAFAALLQAGRTGRSDGELTARAGDGTRVPLHLSMNRLRQGSTAAVCLVAMDLTQRKRAEAALRASEQRLRRFVDANIVGVVIADAAGHILEANDYYLWLVGYTREEFLAGQVDWRALTPPEWLPADERAIRELRERGVCEPYEKEYLRRDGTRVAVYLVDALLPGPGEQIAAFALDVTKQRHSERELRRLNRALITISSCHQALVRSNDETDLMREICRAIVTTGGYRLAWVGFAENDPDKTVRPIASAGYEEGYLERARITWADTERGRGPTGTAIRTGRPAACRDVLADPAYAPWRADAVARGYASSIVLPLLTDGTVFGALNIYASEPDAFDAGEFELLAGLADDLAYGIRTLRMRAERQRIQDALERASAYNRRLIEASLDPLVTIGADGKITDVNAATEAATGCTRAELIGTDFSDYFTEPDRARASYQQVFREGLVRDYPLALRHRDGRVLSVLYNASVYRNEQGDVEGVFAAARDVTEQRRAEDSLHESEDKFRHLFEYSTVGMSLALPSGELQVNEEYCRMLGYSREELAGRKWSDITHPEDVAESQRVMDEIASGRRDAARFTKRYLHKNGMIVWADVSTKARRDAAGKLLYLMTSVSDITASKRAEDALRASAERYARQRNALAGLAARAEPISTDLAARFREITELAARTLGVARVGIWRYNRERTAIVCSDLYETASGRHSSGMELPAARYPVYFGTLTEMDVMAADDAAHDPRTAEFADNYLAPLGITSMLDATVRLHGVVDGVICHEHAGVRREWTPDEQTFAIAIANLVSLAVEAAQRQEAEQALRHERDLFNTLAATMPDLIYFKDREGRFVRINDAMARRFELRSVADAVGRTDFDFFPPEQARQTCDQEQHIIRTREPVVAAEVKETWPDGHVTWASTTKIPWRDKAGGIIGIIGISRDITVRKENERRIREQAELIDKANEAIVAADLANRITFWSRGAERMLGWSAEEMIGRAVQEIFALGAVADTTGISPALASEADWRGEISGRNRDGKALSLEVSITLLRDTAGQPNGRLAICTDITRKKELEERYLRTQRLESLGMLAAGISHDLNNILAPVGMVAPLLRAKVSAPEDRRLLDMLEQCAERGAGLVKQILGFAHGAGTEPRLVQVKHLLRDVANVITETFPKSIVLEEEVPRDLWPILANPTQIHQVLLNLCVNARDAMPQGGKLRLRAENVLLDHAAATALEIDHPGAGVQPGAWLVLHIEDSGTGIAPDVLEHIWEPFFTTKGTGKGTGLGLPTVRGIVEQHHGFVTMRTGVGVGTTFRVYLPAAETHASSGSAPPITQLEHGHGEHILVVDDEQTIRETASAILKVAGYRVTTASDGAEATGLFKTGRTDFALVVTDRDMPRLDGAGLARVIRESSPATKILAISGGTSRAAERKPSEYGDAFLAKPFGSDDLLRAVHQLLTAPNKVTSKPAP